MGRFIFVSLLAVLLLGGCKDDDKNKGGQEGDGQIEMPDEHCKREALRNCQHRYADWSSNPSIVALYNGCVKEIYMGCTKP